MQLKPQNLIIRQLAERDYRRVWQAMQTFTEQRSKTCLDEIWFVEHDPVFTQGQAGKQEHLLAPGDIPVVQVDRGGQVTYHGPGQQVVYLLLDIKRLAISVRTLVRLIEQIIIATLADYNIPANTMDKAPGVYVADKKICSLGLRIKRGCSFHGLALNVNMDVAPFKRINPCGYEGLQITQIADYIDNITLETVQNKLQKQLLAAFNYHLLDCRSGIDDIRKCMNE